MRGQLLPRRVCIEIRNAANSVSVDPSRLIIEAHEDARACLRRLLEEYPDLTISKVVSALVFSQPTLDRMAEGLRLAGMPE